MKIPVMIELFHQVREGKVKLNDPLTIKNEFHSLVDARSTPLMPPTIRKRIYTKPLARRARSASFANFMITVSSNFATNLLIEKLASTIFAPQ